MPRGGPEKNAVGSMKKGASGRRSASRKRSTGRSRRALMISKKKKKPSGSGY